MFLWFINSVFFLLISKIHLYIKKICKIGSISLILSEYLAEKFLLMLEGKRKYVIKLEDEAHLEKVGKWQITPWRIAGALFLFIIVSLFAGFLLFYLTPLKTMLPGYLKQSERFMSEQTMLRLDSLQNVFNQNEAYLSNIMEVFNTSRNPTDSVSALQRPNFLTPDSLQSASAVEKSFINRMQEKERYNVSVVAPLAAESMLFYPLADDAIISGNSRQNTTAKVILPNNSPIGAIADGTIISIDKFKGIYSIMIQHSKGFLSRYHDVGTPLVEQGDRISGGQAIALPPPSRNGKAPTVRLQMWHNGSELIPYDFISPHSSPSSLISSESYDM